MKLIFRKCLTSSIYYRNIAICLKKNAMGASKSNHFTTAQNDLANIAKSLGHPARIAIIEVLLQSRDCICNDIVEILPLSQATISQHLKALKEAGLIQGHLSGKSICYCINHKNLEKLSVYLQHIIQSSRCC